MLLGELTKGKKAIVIVNVASECRYTHQAYVQLVQVYDLYKDKGLEIIAIPSN